MNNKTAAYILGYTKNKNITAQQFIDKYNTYGDEWLRKYVGQDGITSIQNRMNTWVKNNRELNLFTQNGQRTQDYINYVNSNTKVNDYMLYIKTDDNWRKNSSKSVMTSLKKDGYKFANLLYDDQGNLRSEKEFTNLLLKSNLINSEDLKAYNEYKQYRKEVEIALANDKKFNNELIKKGLSFDNVLDYIGVIPKLATAGVGALRNLNQDINNSLPSWLKSGEKGDTRDPRFNRRVAKILNNFNYNELVNAASKKYSDANVVKGNPARLSLGPMDPGTGLSTIGSSKITVNPKGNNGGKAHFGEVSRALNRFEFNSGTDIFSLNGISKDSYNTAKENEGQASLQGQKLLGDLMRDFNLAQTKDSKSKLSSVILKVSPIAAGSSNMSSVTIIPNKEWLDQYLSSDKDDSNNLLTKNEYKNALTYGLSFIMPSKKLNGVTMYEQAYESPMASYINQFNKYSLTNIGGDPRKSYTVTKNNLGTGDYITKITYPEYNPNTGEIRTAEKVINTGIQGGLLESNRDEMINFLMMNDDNINYLHNNYYQGQ